ncbi:hypothetical protein [Deinococcus sp.]|uniref:hypothetical protein n=1 Tax=Deinococcus sp. TaxID=47478 RepID=UPI0025BDE9DC|nr:hypothetical protein [Deinococcus sp.]
MHPCTESRLTPRVLAVLTLAVLGPCSAAGLPPAPYRDAASSAPASAGGLRACVVGETLYQLDRAGRVRSLSYARLVPDNTLRVRQSYDRNGKLTGASVQWSGFAGLLLNVRGAFDRQERLVKETGFRAKGLDTPLRSYLRTVPKELTC